MSATQFLTKTLQIMKKQKRYFLIPVLIILFLSPLFGKDIPVKTKISHITVFLKGAEVTRKGSVTLPAGMQTLVFRSLASDIREESVRIKGQGDLTILSVKPRSNFLVTGRTNPEWRALDEKLKSLTRKKEGLQVKSDVLKSEVSMLEKNQSIAGQNGLSITALDNAMTFYEKKMTAIRMQQLEVGRKIRETEEQIARIKQQMDQLDRRQKMASGEVVVAVRVNRAGTASFELSYYTSRAGWRPGYDVRVEDINKDVDIAFKAYIKQTTGESWEKIPLTLSTGNPSASGNKPELSPWYLDFVRENYAMARKSKGMMLREKAMAAPAPAQSMADYVSETSRMTTTEYEITLPFPIFSEEKEQAVTIKDISLPATYAMYAVPKRSRDAFLVASVAGWKKHDLLSGKMNLFLEGGFVGSSYLDASLARDTLRLTLGRDNRIKVEREKIEDLTSKKILGSNILENHGWKITVMNAKKVPVHLIIEDQIPVSRQKDIVVEPVELSGARLDRITGKCVWDMQLSPGASRSVVLKFSVKYPKNKRVVVD